MLFEYNYYELLANLDGYVDPAVEEEKEYMPGFNVASMLELADQHEMKRDDTVNNKNMRVSRTEVESRENRCCFYQSPHGTVERSRGGGYPTHAAYDGRVVTSASRQLGYGMSILVSQWRRPSWRFASAFVRKFLFFRFV